MLLLLTHVFIFEDVVFIYSLLFIFIYVTDHLVKHCTLYFIHAPFNKCILERSETLAGVVRADLWNTNIHQSLIIIMQMLTQESLFFTEGVIFCSQ